MSFVPSIRRTRGKTRGVGKVLSAVQEAMEDRLLFSAILWSENFNGLAYGPNQEEIVQGDNVWTKTPPTGWVKDDTGVPGYNEPDLPTPEPDNNGKTEWIGWTFAQKDWWVQAAEDQDRSHFTSGNGGVMVADPDEWDDEPHPGKGSWQANELYNAKITTPSIPLTGAKPGTYKFEFDSSWRPEGFDDGPGLNNQTALVDAVYSTGASENLIHWDSDGEEVGRPNGPFYHPDIVNENEHVAVTLNVPAGATSVKIVFQLNKAANDWWWAVDNLALTGDPDVQNVKLIGVSSSEGTAAQNESLYDIAYTTGATPSASATKIVGVASVPDNDAIAFGPATGLLYHASGGTSLSDTPSDPHYRDNYYLETVDVAGGTNARTAVYNANSPQFGLAGPMPSFALPATRRTDAQTDPQFGESAKGPNEFRGIRDFTWSSADNAFFVASEDGIYKLTADGQSTFLSDPILGSGNTAGLAMINLNGQMQLIAGTLGGSDLWILDPATGQTVTNGQISLTDPDGNPVGGVLSIVQSPDGNTLLALVNDKNNPDDPLMRKLVQLDIHLDPDNGNTATATTIGTFTAPISDLAFTYQAGAAPTPHVSKVFINGTNLTNNAAFRGAAGADAVFGYPIPDGANQLRAIPWSAGVNQVSIQFDQDVAATLDQADLAVRGSGGTIGTTAFTYDAPSKTGTWTLGSTVTLDKLRLVLAAAGVTGLDGDWTNPSTTTPNGDTYPSGDGAAGGDFNFRINVLRGDATGDGVVNALDVADVKKRLTRRPGDGVTGSNAYSIFADVNADGVVNALDVAAVKARLGNRITSLPDPATALLFV